MWDYLSKPSSKKPQGELDQDPWTSPRHSPLEELPLPPEHLRRLWQSRGEGAKRRAERGDGETMKVLDFYDLVRQHKEDLRNEDDLWALARCRHEADDRRLMQFLL